MLTDEIYKTLLSLSLTKPTLNNTKKMIEAYLFENEITVGKIRECTELTKNAAINLMNKLIEINLVKKVKRGVYKFTPEVFLKKD